MHAQKRIKVQTQDRVLKQHAVEVNKALGSKEVLDALYSKYPGLASIFLVRGRVFNIQGYNQKTNTLACMVNPSNPKATGQQFRKQFSPKKPKKKPKESAPEGPPLEIIRIPLQEVGGISDRLPREIQQPPKKAHEPKPWAVKEVPKFREVEWSEVTVAEDVSTRLAYSDRYIGEVPDRKTLRRGLEYWFTGCFVDGEGNSRFSVTSKPVYDLEEVNLFTVKTDPERIAGLVDYPFRIDVGKGELVVPIVGEFYGKNGPITDDLEKKGIVERVKDGSGNPVTTPIYVKTMRQLFLPLHGNISLLKVGDRLIIPNSPEAVEEAWNLALPGYGSRYLNEFVDGALREAHKKEPEEKRGSFDEFCAKYRPSVVMKAWKEFEGVSIVDDIVNKIVDELPRRLIEEGVSTEELNFKKMEVVKLPICGAGIKGAGCAHYDGNFLLLDEKGEVQLPPHFRLNLKKDGHAFVVDERFENTKGLMLAIAHQPEEKAPVGGDTILELLSFGRENALLQHGAGLSYITTAVVPLLSKEQVSDLCTDQVALVMNFVLDDSRRIEDLLDKDIPLEGRQDAYKAVVVEKFIPSERRKDRDDVTFVSDHFDTARDIHWIHLCQNLGRNLKAIFNAGFTNPKDQNFRGNLSLDGGLCDTLDLARMKHPREFHSTVIPALVHLSELYEVAGFKRMDFFKSHYFNILLKESLGNDEGEKLFRRIDSFVEPGDPDKFGVKKAKTIGFVTDAFMRVAGCDEQSVWEMDNIEFIDLLKSNVGLMEKVGLTRDSFNALDRAVKTGGPLHGVLANVEVRVSDVHLELDRLRTDADGHLRCETAMSRIERHEDNERIYREKFGG